MSIKIHGDPGKVTGFIVTPVSKNPAPRWTQDRERNRYYVEVTSTSPLSAVQDVIRQIPGVTRRQLVPVIAGDKTTPVYWVWVNWRKKAEFVHGEDEHDLLNPDDTGDTPTTGS